MLSIPLIKNNEGNKTSSDNYRGITLSPVISKLFEIVLLKGLQNICKYFVDPNSFLVLVF